MFTSILLTRHGKRMFNATTTTPQRVVTMVSLIMIDSNCCGSGHAPFQFGYRLWSPLQRRNKHEILGNIISWPLVYNYWCGPQRTVWIRHAVTVEVTITGPYRKLRCWNGFLWQSGDDSGVVNPANSPHPHFSAKPCFVGCQYTPMERAPIGPALASQSPFWRIPLNSFKSVIISRAGFASL